MLAAQGPDRFDIGEAHKAELDGHAFVRERIANAPRKRARPTPLMSDALIHDEAHAAILRNPVIRRRRPDRAYRRDIVPAAVAGNLLIHENAPCRLVDLQAAELRMRTRIVREIGDLVDEKVRVALKLAANQS